MKARNKYTGETRDLSDNMDKRVWEIINDTEKYFDIDTKQWVPFINPVNHLSIQAFRAFEEKRETGFNTMTELHNSIMFAMGRI
jgi:hypothetical protein